MLCNRIDRRTKYPPRAPQSPRLRQKTTRPQVNDTREARAIFPQGRAAGLKAAEGRTFLSEPFERRRRDRLAWNVRPSADGSESQAKL